MHPCLSENVIRRCGGSVKGTSAYNEHMGEPDHAFVLLRHETSEGVHWDLMLKDGQSLATWQLGQDPTAAGQRLAPDGLPARRLPDHRLDYLEYEGPVSGNRGYVARVDRGNCELLAREERIWVFRLAGRALFGHFRLFAEQAGSDIWRLEQVDQRDRG